jgi:glycosyltransferase involved in cell wall biosynthesis
VLITLDADGQHDPDQIPRLTEPIKDGSADLVIGSRFLKTSDRTEAPRYRKAGIRFLTRFTETASHTQITDAQSGFRAYSRKAIEEMVPTEQGMGVSVEMLMKAAELQLRVVEVPVSMRYRDLKTSTQSPLHHGIDVFASIIKFASIRRPLQFYGGLALVALAISVAFGVSTLDIYASEGRIVTNLALISIAAGLFGTLALSPCSYLTRCDQDLIDAHSHLFFSSAIAVRAAKKRRIPVLTTVHGLTAYRSKLVNALQRCYIESVGVWTLRNSSRVVCLTQAEATEVAKLGVSKQKIRVIPVGVDTAKFQPSTTEGNYILWLGRFVPEKGVEYLVEAVSLLLKRGFPVDVLLVGSGPLRNSLQQLAKAKCSTRIKFAESIPSDHVPNLIRRCMIFVLPSIREGFPRTLVEAMACGKPIVAADTPTLREALSGCGVLVEPRDSKSLADAIMRLISEPGTRRALGERARAMALARYDWSQVLKKLNAVYEEILSEPRL